VRAVNRLREADLVLYDSLVDAQALRGFTAAPCFCVGKRAGRESVRQDTIHRLMVRSARTGKRVVRLKGGDPFVFGRGGEEAMALAAAGVPFEVVPGVSAAIAAPLLAGIPVTHRGMASGFLVLSGHDADLFADGIGATQPNAVSLVVLMGMGSRGRIAEMLVTRGWHGHTPAAIVCGASTPDEWIWTGLLGAVGEARPPVGVAGVLVVGEVVRVREALTTRAPAVTEAEDGESSEVKYGRNR
jgi:uroporphyrin-III C-methyltransferase/precorrin-2 dehydrogenase/sirohydrochlorin ferrochelatase